MGIIGRGNRERQLATQLSRSRRLLRTTGVGHGPALLSMEANGRCGVESRPRKASDFHHYIRPNKAIGGTPSTARRASWHKEPFDDPDWLFEPKYDGFRALCYLEQRRNRLISRYSNIMSRFDVLAGQVAAAPEVGRRHPLRRGDRGR
jgi:ATP-dependent DNA ligase